MAKKDEYSSVFEWLLSMPLSKSIKIIVATTVFVLVVTLSIMRFYFKWLSGN